MLSSLKNAVRSTFCRSFACPLHNFAHQKVSSQLLSNSFIEFKKGEWLMLGGGFGIDVRFIPMLA